jgi:hypothetical protein
MSVADGSYSLDEEVFGSVNVLEVNIEDGTLGEEKAWLVSACG